MCRMWWPLTLTYIFKVIWPWLWKSCLLCNVFSSRSIIFFTWDPIVWVIMRRRGVSSERRRSSCSSYTWILNLLNIIPDDLPVSNRSDNMFAKQGQSITSTNYDAVHWHIYICLQASMNWYIYIGYVLYMCCIQCSLITTILFPNTIKIVTS